MMRSVLRMSSVVALLGALALGWGGSASAQTPPSGPKTTCGAVTSTYVGLSGGGYEESGHLFGEACENRSGNSISVSMAWHIPSPEGITGMLTAAFTYDVYDCQTGARVITMGKTYSYKSWTHGATSGSGANSATFVGKSGDTYRPRITGGGAVQWAGIDFKFSPVITGIAAGHGLVPFLKYGACE
jgi:hypothetical protein